MAWITQRWGIIVATLFAMVSITGAYLLGTGALKPNTADAISPTVLLQNVAGRDSDHDGLPNWEEALYGTNPYKSDTFGLGMTDGKAVAKGLIVPKAFALPNAQATPAVNSYFDSSPNNNSIGVVLINNLVLDYITQKKLNGGTSLSKKQITNMVQQILNKISRQIANASPYRTLSQIKVSGSGEVAMRSYAATVQNAFSKYTVSQDIGELTYLQEAMQNPSPKPLEQIRSIATLYKNSAVGLAKMTVPKEVLQAHIELVNAYARMANVSYKLSELNTNPVTTMLALSEYKKDVLALAKGFTDMGSAFRVAGVTLTPSDPGASFVNLMSGISIQQKIQP